MTSSFSDCLKSGGEKLNIFFSDEQANLLYEFYKTVVDYNEKVNLTAILDEKEFVVKHILDSVSATILIPENSVFCDIGAGAGFPSIPLKILRPDLSATLLDSLSKRVDFLNFAISTLGLTNVSAVHMRAEEAGRTSLRESFDVVTARAVAPSNILLEYAIPLLKVSGIFINYKGRDLSDFPRSRSACSFLSAKHRTTVSFSLPEEYGIRNLAVYEKFAETSMLFPRTFAQISKKPL